MPTAMTDGGPATHTDDPPAVTADTSAAPEANTPVVYATGWANCSTATPATTAAPAETRSRMPYLTTDPTVSKAGASRRCR